MFAIFGDIFDYHDWEGSYWHIVWIDAKDAVKHFTMHRTAQHIKELSDPKWQQYLR